jgi:hypothetical protein
LHLLDDLGRQLVDPVRLLGVSRRLLQQLLFAGGSSHETAVEADVLAVEHLGHRPPSLSTAWR